MASKTSRNGGLPDTVSKKEIESGRGGGYECEFVKPPASDVQSECPVCLLVLRDPHSVTCCGKSFCAVCITRLRKSRKRCPTCNASDFTSTPDTTLENAFRKLRVRCGNQRTGCDWVGTLRELDAHLNLDRSESDYRSSGCEFASVECGFCAELYKRRFIAEHETQNCPNRPYACTECHQKGTFESITKIHWFECQQKLLETKLRYVQSARQRQQSGWCSVWLLTLVVCLCAITLAAVLNDQNSPDGELTILSKKVKALEDEFSVYKEKVDTQIQQEFDKKLELFRTQLDVFWSKQIINQIQSHSVPIRENLSGKLEQLQREVLNREEEMNNELAQTKELHQSLGDNVMKLLMQQQGDVELKLKTLISELKGELQQTKDNLQQSINTANSQVQQCLTTVTALETKLKQLTTDCDRKIDEERKEREKSHSAMVAMFEERKKHKHHHGCKHGRRGRR